MYKHEQIETEENGTRQAVLDAGACKPIYVKIKNLLFMQSQT